MHPKQAQNRNYKNEYPGTGPETGIVKQVSKNYGSKKAAESSY